MVKRWSTVIILPFDRMISAGGCCACRVDPATSADKSSANAMFAHRHAFMNCIRILLLLWLLSLQVFFNEAEDISPLSFRQRPRCMRPDQTQLDVRFLW